MKDNLKFYIVYYFCNASVIFVALISFKYKESVCFGDVCCFKLRCNYDGGCMQFYVFTIKNKDFHKYDECELSLNLFLLFDFWCEIIRQF